ncbi:MAG: hypothetical protein DHS20C02_09860 [Micavibrio sp.]|nr:MAG: hypothetical protein DHS20C02_09860 [Micavibrio sp.]
MGAERLELERDAPDHLLPKDFNDVLTRRYFPVLSLTYISSVMGFAAEKGSFVHYLFEDKSAYLMALFVPLWVSVPAVLWIILKGSHLFYHVADAWYKITAVMMTVTLLLGYLLLPEAEEYGVRIYCAVTIPVFFVLYYFFVKGGLPAMAAHPLSALGLTFLLYGGVVNFLY